MNTQTIQLDISVDIFDKVMSFLELLPTNKIDIIQNNHQNIEEYKKESLVDFFQSSPLVGIDLSRNLEEYKGRIEF